MPAYAECGGLMYLSRAILWRGERHEMVGAVPADARMHARPQGRGLVALEETRALPVAFGQSPGRAFPAHEFHYAALENISGDIDFAYRMRRGAGIDGGHDGVVVGSLLASFSHLRDAAGSPWVQRFLELRATGPQGSPGSPDRGRKALRRGVARAAASARSISSAPGRAIPTC